MINRRKFIVGSASTGLAVAIGAAELNAGAGAAEAKAKSMNEDYGADHVENLTAITGFRGRSEIDRGSRGI